MSNKIVDKDRVIQCIKALSRIEGINRYIEGNGLKQDKTIFESIDLIMSYLEEELSNSE